MNKINATTKSAASQLAYMALYSFPVLIFIILYLYNFNPHVADLLTYEDSWVESVGAVASILAAFLFFFIALKTKNKKQTILAIIMSLGFFVVGMEEISWGQRILNIESNEYFQSNNMQGELNLHNFDTISMMNIFYVVTFVFFIIIPLVKEKLIILLNKIRLSNLELFIPSLWILPLFSMTTTMTAYPFTQYIIMIVIALLVLAYLLVKKGREITVYLPAITLAMAVMLSSVITLWAINYDSIGIRSWSTSEYREFLIGLVFFIYAVDVFQKQKKLGMNHLSKKETPKKRNA